MGPPCCWFQAVAPARLVAAISIEDLASKTAKKGHEFNESLNSNQAPFPPFPFSTGSCNACELEVHALNNPYYNLEGRGIKFVVSPRHADMLLVTGPVTKNMENALRIAYDCTPDPKLVVAVGDCGCNGGVFGESYASCGAISNVVGVDVRSPVARRRRWP